MDLINGLLEKCQNQNKDDVMLESFKIESYHESLSGIIDVLKPIKEYYPNYESWIENVVQSGLSNNTRKIRVLKNDNKIAGLSILKDTPDEKKICSLFIHPEYRGESWMYSIFTDSLMYLKTKKPVITIPSTIIKKYHGLIFSNQWKNTSKINNRYQPGIVEYGFNET